MDRSRLNKIIVIVVAVGLSAGLIAGAAMAVLEAGPATTQSVERIFIDLDGDGDVDLLVSGEVIFNVPLSPTPSP